MANIAEFNSEDTSQLWQIVYFIGIGLALFTALYLNWNFIRRGGLTNISVLVLTVLGYAIPTLLSGLLAFSVMGTDGAVVPLTAGLVSVFGISATLILWFLRPRPLIGPMTKRELEAWHSR